MDRHERTPGGSGAGAGGPANTPPFGSDSGAMRTAADHQIPDQTTPAHGASGGGGGKTETEREMERTRDLVAETAAPVMAEKTQEALKATADRVMHDPEVKQQMRNTATAVQHDAQRMAQEKIGELGQKAGDRLNQGMRQAADRIDTAAQRLDQLANERLGNQGAQARVGDTAHALADSMQSVASYLRDNDAQALRADLERQMRERPLQTLLVAASAGWIVGKILR